MAADAVLLRLRVEPGQVLGLLVADARGQAVLPRLDQFGDDAGDPVAGLALAEDDLGLALPQGTVMIDAGELEIFEGQVAKPLEGRRRAETTAGDVREQDLELLRSHATWATGSRYCRKIDSASAIDSIW